MSVLIKSILPSLIFFQTLISTAIIAQNHSDKKSTQSIRAGSWKQLDANALNCGRAEWRPMLLYVAKLHEKATHSAQWPFDYEWEDLGPGYVYGNAFGNWDVIHEVLDVMPSYPEHALHQLLNDIKNHE